jgi:hypothetical protein
MVVVNGFGRVVDGRVFESGRVESTVKWSEVKWSEVKWSGGCGDECGDSDVSG